MRALSLCLLAATLTPLGAQAVSIADADLNGDGVVALADAKLLRPALGHCHGSASHEPAFDIDADGCVGLRDAAALFTVFGQGAITAELVHLGTAPYQVDGADYIELSFAVAPTDLTLADITLSVRGQHFGAAAGSGATDTVSFAWPYGDNPNIARIYLGQGPALRVGGIARPDDDLAGAPTGLRIALHRAEPGAPPADHARFVDLGDRRVRNLRFAHDRLLKTYLPRIMARAAGGDACEDNYPLSYDLEGLLAMFEATGDRRYLQMSFDVADTLLDHAQDLDDDGYLDFATRRNPAAPTEPRFNVALCDWTAGRGIAMLARVVLSEPVLAARYRTRAQRYGQFVSRHLLEKWTAAIGPDNPAMHFPEGVHRVENDHLIHRVAHYGRIASEMYAATGTPALRELIDVHLQRVCADFEDNARAAGTLEWDVFLTPRRPGTPITRRYGKPYDRISDTSHANSTVGFVYSASTLAGLTCRTRPALDELTTTFLEVITQTPAEPNEPLRFADFVDGGLLADGDPPYSLGRFIEDGWIKLGQADARVQAIAQAYLEQSQPVHRLQYQGNLARAYALARWQ